MSKHKKRRGQLQSMTLAVAASTLFSMFLFFPQESLDASLRGMHIWWDVVFPALLPFFIISEIMIGFGVIHFMGVFLEPVMRPLFRVPGIGAFVWAMGLSSGYPVGAKLTAKLRDDELICRAEGERLVFLSATSNPIFMFGAIAVGFFHDVSLGIIIALTHYVANIVVGLAMAFYRRKEISKPKAPEIDKVIFVRALQAMHRARMKDGRTIGKLLGDAVQSSMNTLLMVGGFIIIFSVIVHLFQTVGINTVIAPAIGLLLQLFHISPELSGALFSGLFEMTLGAKIASEAPDAVPIIQKIAITSGLLAFAGFSIHAQIATIISKTDISYKPFFFAKLAHGILTGILTFIFWKPLYALTSKATLPVFAAPIEASNFSLWHYFTEIIGLNLLMFLVVFAIGVVTYPLFQMNLKRQT